MNQEHPARRPGPIPPPSFPISTANNSSDQSSAPPALPPDSNNNADTTTIDSPSIGGVVTRLAGPAVAVQAGSSVMDTIQQFTDSTFTMTEEEIDKWRPKEKNSIIVFIVFRVTPKTKHINDGLSQIIVCVIRVYLLNLWGAANGTGQTYEIFPHVISLDGTRQEPHKCHGYFDLFGVIAKHSAL